ncbi:MAG: CBS domain-containing protein, partial [Rhodocyclaceae bacterium]|nr:CBS domain-containing protein [Rhodocyclaceae bacterium]
MEKRTLEKRTLADILTSAVVGFTADAPLAVVLDAMEQLRISCVVAVDLENRPIGILTERDVVELYVAARSAAQTSLGEVMSTPVFGLPVSTDYRAAYQEMAERQLRHLLALDEDGRLAGIVTEADFLHHLGEEYLVEVKTVASAMDRDVICLEAERTLGEALELMRAKHSDYVVVTAPGGREALGILTERDVVRLARAAIDRNRRLDTLMTPAAHVIEPEAPLQEASLRMRQLAVRRLLVVGERQG